MTTVDDHMQMTRWPYKWLISNHCLFVCGGNLTHQNGFFGGQIDVRTHVKIMSEIMFEAMSEFWGSVKIHVSTTSCTQLTIFPPHPTHISSPVDQTPYLANTESHIGASLEPCVGKVFQHNPWIILVRSLPAALINPCDASVSQNPGFFRPSFFCSDIEWYLRNK